MVSTRTLRHAAPAAALLALLAATSSTRAAEPDETPARAMYLRYCAACHGPAGKGDGIAGSLMQPKPPDITGIAKANGGEFPFQRIAAYIDGTSSVRAHGDSAMPVWGETFRQQPGWEMSRRVEVQGKVLLITDYVRSLQTPAAAP
ncbi:MAG: c-type cytochrome [bacterium]|nr:c-type cytochrome [bacterium]